MSIRKNMVSNVVLTASSILFPLITFPYITRTLSGSSMGKYFFTDALTQYFIVFSAVGIPYYGIREVAKVNSDAQARSKLVTELLSIQGFLALAGIIILWAIHYTIPALKNEPQLVAVSCLGIISSAFLMEWFYQGAERFSYITSRSLILKALSVLSIILLVKDADNYVLYYLLLTLLITANALFNFINYRKKYHQPYQAPLNITQHIKPLLILFSINISVSVYAILDTIILGLLTNPEQVSYYNVPLKLVKLFWMVVNGAGAVLIPRIAAYFVQNQETEIRLIMRKSLSIVMLLTLPFALLCLLFPHEILTIVSGEKYAGAATALQILSVVPMIIAVCNVFGTQYLMPTGNEKPILYATLAGLVVSLTANFILIPYLKFLGAAISCLLAETMVCIWITFVASKKIKPSIDVRLLLHILLSVVIAVFTKILLNGELKLLQLMLTVAGTYCMAFVALQFAVFKNEFIFSLIGLRKNKTALTI